MSDLDTFKDDKKLQDIVADTSLDFTYMLGCLVDQQRFGISVDPIVRAIKQAFKDAGYRTPSVMDLRMDGSQWYERFMAELKSQDTVEKFYPYYAVEKAAKKASNIE